MRILVFSAHPDDAEFAMGGTLVQLATNHDIVLYVLTKGDAGSFGSSTLRQEEQEAAAKLLNAELRWGNMQDCHIEYTRSQAFAIANIIREIKPDIVFVPHWDQQGGPQEGKAHPDHRALGLLVRDAVRFARFRVAGLQGDRHTTKQLLYYMLPQHRMPKIAIPIDVTAFKGLLNTHKTQMQLKGGSLEEYLLATRRLAAQYYPGVEYAETFDADEPVLFSAEQLI